MEDLVWKERVLAERAAEQAEWKMMTSAQLESQIERIGTTLSRQTLTNTHLEQHCQSLDQEIKALTEILDGLKKS